MHKLSRTAGIYIYIYILIVAQQYNPICWIWIRHLVKSGNMILNPYKDKWDCMSILGSIHAQTNRPNNAGGTLNIKY